MPGDQRHSKRESENESRQPGDLTENRQSDSLNQELTYSFSGDMKKGDDKNEMRTTAKPQVRVAFK